MFKLLELPTDILADILPSWIGLDDVFKLDYSFCNTILRRKFLDVLRDNSVVFHRQGSCKLKWIGVRHVKLRCLDFLNSADDNPEQCLLDVSRVEVVYWFDGESTISQSSHESIINIICACRSMTTLQLNLVGESAETVVLTVSEQILTQLEEIALFDSRAASICERAFFRVASICRNLNTFWVTLPIIYSEHDLLLLVKNNPNLEQLHINTDKCVISLKTVEDVLSLVTNSHCAITKLEISLCKGICFGAIAELLSVSSQIKEILLEAPQATLLHSIRFIETAINDRALTLRHVLLDTEIGNAFFFTPMNLQKIDLYCDDFDASVLYQIANNNLSLHEFRLQFLNSHNLSYGIRHMFGQSKMLSKLAINSSFFSADNELIDVLCSKNDLNELTLGFNNINTEICLRILRSNRQLEVLELHVGSHHEAFDMDLVIEAKKYEGFITEVRKNTSI